MRRFTSPSFARNALRALACAALLTAAAITSAADGGGAAPDFALTSRAGQPVSLKDLKGKVVMVNFWASWCGPCRQEFPLLDQMYKKYSPLGFTLLGVNVESDTKDAEKWLAQTPVTFPILFDKKNEVSKLYSVNAMPSTVFIDRKGNVRYMHHGYKPGDEGEYLNQIRALVKE